MGMAASQARLLSLTARQHTVEGRAQFLQAQKLRLANESDTAYLKYLDALDATSLQTKTYDEKGKVHWVDGSFNNLLRYGADEKSLGEIYYVQDIKDGKLYMPQRISDAHRASGGDLFKFLDEMNIKYQKDAYNEEYQAAYDIVKAYENAGYDKLPYAETVIDKYSELRNLTNSPTKSKVYNTADELSRIVGNSEQGEAVYLPWDESQYKTVMANLETIKGSKYYTGDVKTIIDYCNSFDVPDIFNNPDSAVTVSAHTGEPSKDLYVYWDRDTEKTKNNDSDVQNIDDLMKFKMMLNGGVWKKIDTNKQESSGNIYSDAIKNTLSNYVGTTNSNIGEAIVKMSGDIMKAEMADAQTTADNNLEAFFKGINVTQVKFEADLENHRKYLNAVADLTTKDQTTYTKYEDKNLGPYYEEIFNAIESAGGCKEISNINASSPDWVNNMVKNAQVVLATFDSDKKEIDNVTASSNTGLREITNDAEIAKADSEYEATLQDIDSKDTKFSTQLNQLESERSAIATEIESLKKIAKENIASTFKLFT